MASPTYESVHVAMLRWKSSRLALKTRDEIDLLRHAFRDLDFQLNDIEIPTSNSDSELQRSLRNFYEQVNPAVCVHGDQCPLRSRKICRNCKTNKRPALVILFYSGHATSGPDRLFLHSDA
jgi:hypothetical protein